MDRELGTRDVTLLIDPPIWPAHGRSWSHLVSDTSLHELRAFARAHGVPDRSFDLDHHDVPAERYDELVAAGARPVSGGELARRLAASGLRVAGRERRRAYRGPLLERWASLWPTALPTPLREPVARLGTDLVDRWSEAHRVYHSRLHLADTLDALDSLSSPELSDSRRRMHRPRSDNSVRAASLALWFHDAVHDGVTPDDEQRSAALARDLLAPLTSCQTLDGVYTDHVLTTRGVAEVERLVQVTAGHDPDPQDTVGALVVDADLAILGADPARYRRYTAQVRAEYGHVPDDAFRDGRAAVLDRLLTVPTLYRTPAGRARWGAAAQRNLRAELADLQP